MKKLAFMLDVLLVLVFVGIGRSAHQHGLALTGMASTSWPFLVGLLAGWLVVRKRRGTGLSPRQGGLIVLVMVVLGMVLRVVSGQGTAAAFVVVALVFLLLFLVGWRAVRMIVLRRR